MICAVVGCDQIRNGIAAALAGMPLHLDIGLQCHVGFGVSHVGLHHRQGDVRGNLQRGEGTAEFAAVYVGHVERAANGLHFLFVHAQRQWVSAVHGDQIWVITD